ncbi:retropepsin-like aspartic protease [Xanthomarina spongicola]|uniref:Clan AA aspartic protease (TIGR02281 family) n=1 Tax=Xanthomarina spongicola TaxID=570520 RepID=A0A316DGJ0_9FLAO|nr:retropepsin-like aspartic protease [Xanthomarina spongicola]PWK16766.1 clan AA aspartic protease (TIGR02281 family) [Xanthomarina spongicola]
MKKIILCLFILLTTNEILAQTTINLDKTNGVYTVPCKVNGIPMDFIFDTGASNVTISLTEATFLIKQGLLGKNDIKESVKYQIANGDINEGTNIILREIEIAGLKIKNVKATIVHEQNAPLLLGMSALSQLGKIEIENNKLIINDFSFKSNKDNIDFDKEVEGTIEWINSVFVKYQYEEPDLKQKQNIHSVVEIENQFYLFGVRTQETSKPWAFSKGFLIPLAKINNIDFSEKKSNYWLEVKLKNNEEAIVMIDGNDKKDYIDRLEFMLDKSIDNESLMPKLKNALEYIIELYNEKPPNKSSSFASQGNKEIRIKYKNGIEIFNIHLGSEQPNYKENKEYFWYTEFSKIKSTKGGSGGNLLNGNYKFFDENGNLLIDENYSMGLKNGDSKKWDEKGELTEINKYEDGESVYWKYHPEGDDGWVEQIGQMLKAGWIKNSYDRYNNIVASQKTFVDEKSQIKKEKTKTSIYFRNSNQKKEEYTTLMMFNNSYIGEYIQYFENGNKKVYGKLFDPYDSGIDKYVGNIRDGEWKWYKENGEIDSTEKYKAVIEYWDNGNLKYIYGQYFDEEENKWLKHGRFYSYGEDGKGIGEIIEYEWGVLKEKE